MAPADAPRTRRTFARLSKALEVPNLIDIQKRSFDWLTDPGDRRSARDDRRHLADRGLHRQPRGPVRRVHLRRSGRLARRVSREGPHLRPPADRHGRLRQPRDRRDPRAVRLHGRLPLDDGARHVHHQRHRARRRDAAGPFPGRVPDGGQGPREAGLHREPDAGPRLLARARDRQEGQGLRPHRPQAQAAGHGAAAGDGLLGRRRDPQPVRGLALHPQHDRERHRGHEDRGRRPDRAVQAAAPGRAAVGRRRQSAAPPALLRPEALRPHARRSLQAELASAPRHRPRDAHADARRHHRAHQGARLAAAHPRHARSSPRSRSETTPRRPSPTRARPSPTTSTSTSTSATAVCAPSAS